MNHHFIFSPLCFNINTASCASVRSSEDNMTNPMTTLKHHHVSPPACAPSLPTVPDSHIESIQSLRIKAAERINQIRENCTPST